MFRLGLCTPFVLPDIGAFEVEAYVGDDDGDGVIDVCDACPDTPPDTIVDPNGCVIPGDFDHDADVDTDDVDAFASCASRDKLPRPPGCEAKDFDGDNDCVMNDFAIVQRCCSGANIPGNPGCAN